MGPTGDVGVKASPHAESRVSKISKSNAERRFIVFYPIDQGGGQPRPYPVTNFAHSPMIVTDHNRERPSLRPVGTGGTSPILFYVLTQHAIINRLHQARFDECVLPVAVR